MPGRKLALLFTLAAVYPATNSSAAVSPKAEVLFPIFGLPVTNSMVTGWVVSILLIIAIRIMVGRPSLVPSKGQAIIESVLNFIRETTAPIVGKKAIKASLPVIVGLFFYILIQNWSGLIPGVGSIGGGTVDAEGHFHLTDPWIRPANADWNGTIALAAVAMIAWLFIVLKLDGPAVLIKDLFGNKADKKEVGAFMWMALWPIFLIVGVIEVVSILIRPLTLSVRLFGNIYGGESLLHQTGFIFPFYFLELIVGFVQPLVFILLFSVYIGLICNHGDGEEHH
ncbi:F0F1 ATP synthase subunit A [Pelagicoccus sp. SDUM812003]|uniref:F0F1 ATP synthase subunit A n=1 Tax=Pelagicoccus sp. SDUM812003 TaxID=3041267 RepID=UPI00280F9BE1|nr:F0F1 ATP synthase subunit A [Pelagicoccus sp. SDUM812003]MDQ8204237.1 F0F1 ATP synthase subunit A [Pelagicoccus sp. SDUM812003]